MNLTEETKEITPRKIKYSDKKWINSYLKEHFGENVNFDYEERTMKLCDNTVLATPEFILLMQRFKFYILPSLF